MSEQKIETKADGGADRPYATLLQGGLGLEEQLLERLHLLRYAAGAVCQLVSQNDNRERTCSDDI